MSVTPLRRTSRNSRMVIASWLARLGSMLAISLVVPAASAAPGGDDWSLENKGDAPALVSQRIGRLRRSPLDGPQWRALQKAIGSKRLAAKINAMQRRNPGDVALRILAARATSAQGDPAAAARTLEGLIGKAGRFENAVFWLRIDMLDSAGEDAAAVRALESRAATQQGASADKALNRALSIADQAQLTGAAHRIAKALADNHPTSFDARLRLARAATQAGDSGGADAAYATAVSSAPSRKKHALVAERARARLRTDNPSGAAKLLWGLLENPATGSKGTRERWWDLLADAHRKDGSTAMLITRLSGWVARNDKDPSAWRTLAQMQETAGMDALAAWRKVLLLAPKDQQSHAALVEALESKGETAAAVAEYKRLANRDPSEVALGLEMAGRLLAAGKREQGLQLAAEIEARVARRGSALMALLDFYNLNDEQHLALDVAERLVVLAPRKAEARIALGEQLYQMRRHPAALKTWAMLPKLIRPAAAGWARHAEVLSEHGHTPEAIVSLNKALKLAPAEPKYVRLRAVLAEDQRRPDTALGLWQQVRTLATKRNQPLLADEARTRVVELLVGGAIAKRRQRLETEQRLARKALDAKVPLSDAIEAGRFLAELQTRREHYGAAVSVQHQLVELMPDDATRLAELATAQRRAGQVESALSTLEELLVTKPGRSADVLAEMSELAFEAGDSTRALDAANRAAAKDRTQVDALVRLGEMHEREGDTDEARKAYAAALAVDATDVGARLRLAELELTLGEVDRSAHAFREILALGGPPELLREAGRRALDLAEADGATMELVALAVQRTQQRPEATEPREFLLEALDRAPLDEVTAWLRADDASADAKDGESRATVLRQPLVAALTRGSVGARVRAAEHLGRLNLPDTAVPLARMGATLTAPRDATATVRDAFDRARVMALRAAGELRDGDAIVAFNDAMTDASLSMGARHAAAWALAQADEPAAAKALMGNLSWGHDPMLAALGCIALARQSAADVSDDHARRAARLARGSRHPQVRHACTLAEASLTPDHRWSRLAPMLQSSDPVLAAIAAWRVGLTADTTPEAVQALTTVVIGPAGLHRDAATAALARLVKPGDSQPLALDSFPAAPRNRGWSTVIERWLEDQVAPDPAPVQAADLAPYAAQISAALDGAADGTRAEQLAARAVTGRCPAEPRRKAARANRLVCLSPLLREAIEVPAGPTELRAPTPARD